MSCCHQTFLATGELSTVVASAVLAAVEPHAAALAQESALAVDVVVVVWTDFAACVQSNFAELLWEFGLVALED